ncbi:hypothetical protein [Tenacibaculum mesophilum]|uniref:hypothetical protein n=1 Tax=Tenacibaculum mesophilum TaxID=104268 RepID=UPI002490E017|nr:hypothetical protein [Tenacibaculum mesophilum]
MKKIIDIEGLLEYLKIPEFKEKGSQEVILKKITQQALFEEEAMQIRVFQQAYKEVSIPQTLYIDENNVAYTLHGFSSGEVFYKNISYDKDDRVFDKEELANLKEVRIPDEIYNQGYEFYINEENHLVAVIFATYASSSNDYISYKPSTFSYVKEYAPILTYHYINVYGTSANEKIKIESENTGGLLHRFPILSRSGARGEYTYQLSYYYKKDSNEVRRVVPAEEDYPFIGIRIHFKDLTTVLSFLNQTIFYYYDEFNDFRSKWRSYFLVEVTAHIVRILNRSGADAKKVALIYHLSQPLYDRFEGSASLWNTLEILAKGYVRNNLSINNEDLIIKLLKIIYHRYTHKQIEETFGNRTIKTEKEKQHIAGINNEFITNLITRKVDGKLLLYKLVKGLDGEHFQTYVYFIWKIWKSSSYADINPETNKLINITEKSPVLLDYRSNKKLGFYTDNATIDWEGEKNMIDIVVSAKTGEFEEKEIEREDITQKILVEKKVKLAYQYHPFAPIVLVSSENPKFILKEEENSNISFTKLPAFVLFANKEKAFWENVLKGVGYAVDIVTTVSGVGNILKAGRIYRLLKNGKTLLYKTAQVTKTIATAKAVAGVIEVSSGTVNTLLKLTELDDTELGKTITKYLFYLEMLSLAGEATALLKDKLSKTAKELVENPKLTKSLDDLVRNEKISELEEFKFYEELFTVYRQYIEDLKVLGIVPKLTHAAEKAFLRRLKQVFYKQYKSVLLKLNSDVVIIEKWNNIALSKPLLKLEIEELLDLRKLKKSAFNKNTAILEVDLLVQGKKVTLKYKAIAGKGQSAEGLVKSANQEDLIRQLELNDKNELNSHFQAIDKQTGDLKNRFQDSEVKMLDTFDEDLSVFHVTYGKENIQVTNMRLNTLYEPCISCKKQIIIRQEIYDIKRIDVRAVYLGKGEFVQGNNDLKKLGII